MELFSTAVILFLVLDPFGNLPILGTVMARFSAKEQRRILIRETLIALFVLLFFLFLGSHILEFLGLDTSALRISGGFILLLIGIGMLFPSKSVLSGPGDDTEEDPFIVPIAIPLIAGPSAITYVMLLAKQYDSQLFFVAGTVTLAWAASAAILFMSPLFLRFLGKRGMRALERLMGMILVILSVQILLDGFAIYLNLPAKT